jgi:hypothetical protein
MWCCRDAAGAEQSTTQFLRSIASRLDGAAHPSDSQIEAAINFILSVGGVSVDGSVLLCNSSTKGGHHHGPTKQNAIRR